MADEIVPPTDGEIESKLGGKVLRRELSRATPLSIVESVELKIGSDTRSAVVKTVVPALEHELSVNMLVKDDELCAAPVLAAVHKSDGSWLAAPGLDIASNRELDADQLPDMMRRLARFHTMERSPAVLEDLWDRSPIWQANDHGEVERLLAALRDGFGAALSGADIESYVAALDQLAKRAGGIPVTLVHGDFDPGNVVFANGAHRALDWGLAHVNIPTVDVAHMLLNFAPSERTKAFEAYRRAYEKVVGNASWLADAEEALLLGDLAHKAFFVWWHSKAVVEHGLDASQLAPVVAKRMRFVVGRVAR